MEHFFLFCCLGIPYQYVWKSAAGKKRHAEQEFNNPMEELAVKVITNNEMSAICLESSDKYLGIFLHMVERYVSK